MKLAKLIEELTKWPPAAPLGLELVGRDDGPLVPYGIDSYRGYYEQLAIEYKAGGDKTVGEFIADLEDAVGRTFEGYKGGEYTMTAETNLWCSNWGECIGWAPLEVVARSEFPQTDGVVIRAFNVERW